MKKILLVDDDSRLLNTLRINLSARGYDVCTSSTGADALRKTAELAPDVVVLDMGLPDIDGTEVLQGIRGWSSIPVVVLTARADPLHSAAVLDLGADDYVSKPFSMEELMARIRAALRHGGPQDKAKHTSIPRVVTLGDATVDLGRMEAFKAGEKLHFTPTEWGVLKMLIAANGGLVRKSELLDGVWGPGFERQGHYLRIYVSQLRQKLEDDPSKPRHVITETGLGYRLLTDDSSDHPNEQP